MLTLQIESGSIEEYDAVNNRFYSIDYDGGTFTFEHSLKAIAEWEAIYHKPFLSDLPKHSKTAEEASAYIKIMCHQDNFNPISLNLLQVDKINKYMRDTQTATVINPRPGNNGHGRSIMTADVIYAYMANAQIPFSCEDWHINRLLVVLGVLGELNSPAEKMSSKDVMAQNKALNEQRKAQMNSKG